jgi:hypothetical protein
MMYARMAKAAYRPIMDRELLQFFEILLFLLPVLSNESTVANLLCGKKLQ